MRCVRCNTKNRGPLDHCQKCGAPLQFKRRFDLFPARKVTIILAVFLLWLSSFAFLFRDVLFSHPDDLLLLSTEQGRDIQDQKLTKRRQMVARLRLAMQESKTKGGEQAVPGARTTGAPAVVEQPSAESEMPPDLGAGWAVFVDPWGNQVAKISAALMGGGWLALPTRAAYAGYRWTFYREEGTALEIVDGLWRTGEAVGLWHLARPVPLGDRLGLAPWSEREVLRWLSLDSQNEISDIRLAPGNLQGDFVVCPTPAAIKETGVFVQRGSIVGWSFGPWLGNVYLWRGGPEAELRPETDVRKFYAKTFAGGREEKFGMALAMKGGHSDLERLTALVDGFALKPRLALDDTPDSLKPARVVTLIRQLTVQLIREGQGGEVVNIVNDDTLLREIGDLQLLMDLIPAITAGRGFEPAIQKIEGVGRYLVVKGGVDVPAVNETHLRLYQEWLQTLVTEKAVAEASEILARAKGFYPGDPYLHLLGVEFMLLNNDWREAERLLFMMEYPPQYQDRSQLLARRIAEMKGDEGAIVIRFPAGENRIPVAAGLNQSIRQEFIVDTGSSMVTIPSATAEALRLEALRDAHGGDGRSVSTAGGTVVAHEVRIESLEIEGWVEHNVRALVLDIPDHPGVGLLGLNYLSRFQLDLNTDEGKLALRPK